MPYAELGDPQTLNLYAYGRNNPVTLADADGHTIVDDAWMSSGYMMQQAGFGFHLRDGVQEGMGSIALGVAPGATVLRTMQFEIDVSAGLAPLDPALLLQIDASLLYFDAMEFRQLGVAEGWWNAPVVLPPPVLPARREPKARDGAQDKKLTPGEIERLKKGTGRTPEEIKADTLSGNARVGGYDLYKTPGGEIVVKPKGGGGTGEPTDYTVRDLQ